MNDNERREAEISKLLADELVAISLKAAIESRSTILELLDTLKQMGKRNIRPAPPSEPEIKKPQQKRETDEIVEADVISSTPKSSIEGDMI